MSTASRTIVWLSMQYSPQRMYRSVTLALSAKDPVFISIHLTVVHRNVGSDSIFFQQAFWAG